MVDETVVRREEREREAEDMAGKASKLHEKHQTVLANMLREEENKLCADCHAKGEYLSLFLSPSESSEDSASPLAVKWL